ncbi:MAG: DUF559 domain-containing protein [Planctomycetia bacterium]|nr:DUF559 domain-containing protein [Planctomycetia bacterium]
MPDEQIAQARDLRQDATFPERLLWGKLRNGRLAGIKFRRQFPLGATNKGTFYFNY